MLKLTATAAILCFSALLLPLDAAQAQPLGTIWVVGGTYGDNCGVPHGNKTAHLAKACNGQASCSYRIDYKTIGDPKVGCAKDYVAEWRCIGSPRIHRASAAKEAGFGKRVELSCSGRHTAPPPHVEPPPSHRGAIEVIDGTYGGNCGASRGNKTRHLAKACNGRTSCDYTIDYRVIGDPKVGCAKDYVARWRCAGSDAIRSVSASPEAGYKKRISLSCSRASTGSLAKAGIRVIAGTYGKNCGATRGNKTQHLAERCNGRSRCPYTIDYRVIGDPKVGCAKNYIAEWMCAGSPRKRQAVVAPEAGFKKQVVLGCD